MMSQRLYAAVAKDRLANAIAAGWRAIRTTASAFGRVDVAMVRLTGKSCANAIAGKNHRNETSFRIKPNETQDQLPRPIPRVAGK